MWNVVLPQLPAADQVHLGLCTHQTNVSFWRCLGSTIWYTPDVFYKLQPHGRTIRKLHTNLSDLCKNSDTDRLTHLHVSNIGDSTSIVFPQNLVYLFLAKSSNLLRGQLPMSLTFLDSKTSCRYLLSLNHPPKLTFLRTVDYFDQFSHPKSLPLLTALNTVFFEMENMVLMPNLTKLNIKYWSANESNSQICGHVQSLSFRIHDTTVNSAMLAKMFPNVTSVKIHCTGENVNELPMFKYARRLFLKVSHTRQLDLVSQLDKWDNLEDLTIVVSAVPSTSVFPVFIPPHVKRLRIKCCNIEIPIWFSHSVTYANLTSSCSVFDVTMPSHSQLRTLRTTGNVFLKKVILPVSLRSFHVRLFGDETLDQQWDNLPLEVDFQVNYK